jgi:hypothetical protein
VPPSSSSSSPESKLELSSGQLSSNDAAFASPGMDPHGVLDMPGDGCHSWVDALGGRAVSFIAPGSFAILSSETFTVVSRMVSSAWESACYFAASWDNSGGAGAERVS